MLLDDEKGMEELMKSDNIPKDLERMRFIGGFLLGHREDREDRKKNFAEVYSKHYNINLADMSSSGLEIIVSIFDVIIVGLIAFNYWLAYRIFTHIQVINNKWFNLVW
jgi:hypothetical protein